MLFESNPCGQNGVCISTGSSYVCVCDPDYAGRICEINLKKSKCPEANDQSIGIFNSQIFKNLNCKNLVLGGFICDKCDSSEEPSASSYYNSLCELRARNFPQN